VRGGTAAVRAAEHIDELNARGMLTRLMSIAPDSRKSALLLPASNHRPVK